mmetsp:Transcript_78857/g.244702  ORF Transcript_78857/g.244702 Transcript_78857/m.244702 type:complete len:245 (+) Transcript_78857:505-1239(+)
MGTKDGPPLALVLPRVRADEHDLLRGAQRSAQALLLGRPLVLCVQCSSTLSAHLDKEVVHPLLHIGNRVEQCLAVLGDLLGAAPRDDLVVDVRGDDAGRGVRIQECGRRNQLKAVPLERPEGLLRCVLVPVREHPALRVGELLSVRPQPRQDGSRISLQQLLVREHLRLGLSRGVPELEGLLVRLAPELLGLGRRRQLVLLLILLGLSLCFFVLLLLNTLFQSPSHVLELLEAFCITTLVRVHL